MTAISVIMPVLNEEADLADSVAAVLAQDAPGELELVLACGPSTDRTWEVAAGLAARDPRVTVIENPTGRTPDGLNAALEVARHPVVVRVDAHGELSPGYLRTAVEVLERTGAANVGGVMHAVGRTDFERAVAVAMGSPLGVGGARFHTGGEEGESDTVYLGSFRREWLDRVGGYDPRFDRAQDWEMNWRIRQAGGHVWFTPAMRVDYRPRRSLRALARQYRDYGRWRRVVAATHEGSINLRYLAPPTALVACAVGAVAGLAWRPAWAVPGAYLAAVTAGGLWEAREQAPAVALRVPAVVATMHMAWGWGFLTSPAALRREIAGR
ncbi:glycosyltransferase family 2 protein [Kytococcus sedentarius]|uniref:Glycosyl transferase n=1 Tax=Kytococcus sedentarius (strain ATCC 14392 / DSM 20547 / JCM 11482 / CCUG 33030 / NBRC 15357 / NCTC 11040 / CCM 314 / 541) TaxID=478801 RepID=C7NFG7_KYTSD|nr:glycosyltransferase family 2 protein [Kytococcus sedentarius]ACV05902.1 glycosyl transferase [Kytococcus sedentarius DSM 20547]STX12682.1 N-glycosyltransferase [Kytococcus sedentarius]